MPQYKIQVFSDDKTPIDTFIITAQDETKAALEGCKIANRKFLYSTTIVVTKYDDGATARQ